MVKYDENMKKMDGNMAEVFVKQGDLWSKFMVKQGPNLRP